MAIWFDVEDLVRYFHYASQPTGIQRLSFEMYAELWRQAGSSEEIRFCRRGGGPGRFRSVHFPALEAGILAESSDRPARSAAAGENLRARLETFGRSIAPRWRQPLGEIFRGAMQMAAGLRNLVRAGSAQLAEKTLQRAKIGGFQFDIGSADIEFAAGDWFVNLGASWDSPYNNSLLRQLHEDGVKFALVVYDLIPELFPEWAIAATLPSYRHWLRETVPAADLVFAISQSTAADLGRCLAALGKPVPPLAVLPVGSIKAKTPLAAAPVVPSAGFVLFVSTIEARKNHILMFRVWRRLLQAMPTDAVPELIFAGKIGWLTADLIQQLDNTGWLDGKIKFRDSPSDAELATLYRDCSFTVFPSFYEGWGLPVTESLSHGKTVAASDRAAVREAGGDFCAYYDPDDLNAAYQVIAELIQSPGRLAEMERHIARDFRPPGWVESAACLLRTLQPAEFSRAGIEAANLTNQFSK